MKNLALGVVLATMTGVAAAADPVELRDHQSDEYTPRLTLQTQFGEQGFGALTLNGVDLRGTNLATNAAEGGGFFSSLSLSQWIALGFTVGVFGIVAYDATDENNPTGTGSSGY